MGDLFHLNSDETFKRMAQGGFTRLPNPMSPGYGTFDPTSPSYSPTPTAEQSQGAGMDPAYSPVRPASGPRSEPANSHDEPRTEVKKQRPLDETTAEQLDVWIKHPASTQRSTGKGAWTLEDDIALIDGKKRGATNEAIRKELGREAGRCTFNAVVDPHLEMVLKFNLTLDPEM